MICGLARCNRDDIEKAFSAIKDAPRHRIHVFLATSAIHREHKLNMAKEEILKTAVECVRFAKSLAADVEFSPEDASRTELEFLAQVVEAAIDAGATTINVPDTVGYTTPQEFAEVFAYLRRHERGIERARCCRCTATTTSAWRSPTACRRRSPGRGRSSARSTASASAPATARSRKS